MAEPSEQAQLVKELLGKGFSVKDIAALSGRSSRYITLARDSTEKVGRGGKVSSGRGQNLIPFLKQLNEKGRVTADSQPARRQTKSGKVAKTRHDTVRSEKTQSGKQIYNARVKKGPATLKRTIGKASGADTGIRWDVKFKKLTTKSKAVKKDAWVSGHLPRGWTAQTLQDRISNPQAGDSWRPGDVNGALATIALEQNSNSVISAMGASEFNMSTIDYTPPW